MRQLIIFFHGYGADPANFQGVVEFTRRYSRNQPGLDFLNLPGLSDCELGSGRQWFSLEGVLTEKGLTRFDCPVVQQRIKAANEEILVRIAEKIVNYQEIFLLGFSQGGMMVLDLGLYSGKFSKIVSFAGCLIRKGQPLLNSKICLIHGQNDEIVKPDFGLEAREFLTSQAVDVTYYATEDAHNISEPSLIKGLDFLLNK